MITEFNKAWRLTYGLIHHNMHQHLATSVGHPPPHPTYVDPIFSCYASPQRSLRVIYVQADTIQTDWLTVGADRAGLSMTLY
jgi:hypothetical protein